MTLPCHACHPGRTRSIQHFLVNQRWYLVDLPGYGYAKVSREQRNDWRDMTQDYFIKRPSLAHVFLLLDAGAIPHKLDMQAAHWLHQHQVSGRVRSRDRWHWLAMLAAA